jgi:RimJ/RimL family protein N-acetyltransferase
MSDRLAIRRWMQDFAVIGFTVVVPGPDYGPVEPYDAAAADHYLEVLVRDPQRRSFAIVWRGEHVGNVGLKHIDLRQETAECFIEVGEVSARRHGVGAAAMGALLDVAFDELRLKVVRLGVFEFNTPALRLYSKLGFELEDDRGDHWLNGRKTRVLGMRIDPVLWMRHRPRGATSEMNTRAT